MTKCVNRLGLSGELNLTYGAVNYALVRAVSGTGGSNLVLLNCLSSGVTECINRLGLSGELNLTCGAVNYALVRACYGTGGSNLVLLNCLSSGMSKRLTGGSATNLTGLSGYTVGILPGVSVRIDRSGIDNSATALNGTVELLETGIITSGISNLFPLLSGGVAERCNNLLCKSNLITASTYSTVGQAVGGTGSCIAGYSFISVTECLALSGLTQGTSLGSKAGSLYPNMLEGLALFNITLRTMLSTVARCGDPDMAESLAAGSTAKGTGSRGLTICSCPLMVQRSALSLITEGTYLGSFTGSLCPCMRKSFTFSSSAGTSLRCLTGSLHPIVHMLRLRLFTKEGRKLIARSKCEQKDQ